MRSSRSRTAASGSTTASTCAASCVRSPPTSGSRGWSRAARRSPSSSSRTRLTATRRRSRARCEAAFAWQLERSKDWPKRRILQEYLNTIYFGNGAYGIQQAARTYFQHGAKDLTVAESALLAGIPADPSRYDPVTNPKAALARRATVLNAMLEEGKITLAQLREAAATPLFDVDDVRWADRGAGAALRQLRQAAADRRVRLGRRVRRRAQGADDDRPRAAAQGARRDLEVAHATRRPVGGVSRDRPPQRRRPRDGRRQQLSQESVQPRRPGCPPARLVLQAVRAR